MNVQLSKEYKYMYTCVQLKSSKHSIYLLKFSIICLEGSLCNEQEKTLVQGQQFDVHMA